MAQSTTSDSEWLERQGERLARALGMSSRAGMQIAALAELAPLGSVERAGALAGKIGDLLQDVWDADPCLATSSDLAVRFPDELGPVARLLNPDAPANQKALALEELGKVTPAEVRDLLGAAGQVTRVAVVLRWLERRGGARPLTVLDRELTAPRRWRRVYAAKALRRVGGPNLLCSTGRDVETSALQQWRVRYFYFIATRSR